MKNLNIIFKVAVLPVVCFSLIQCEKDKNDSEDGAKQSEHNVLVNGVRINVNETQMYINDNPHDNSLSIISYCSDGLYSVFFNIEPPSLDSIDGLYEHQIGMVSYDLDYSGTVFGILNSTTGETDLYSSKLRSEVTVTHQGNDIYLFELDMSFEENDKTYDVTGSYTAKFEK